MWEIMIEFDDEETIHFRGDAASISLWDALRLYNLFAKEAGGKASYMDEKHLKMPLERKINELTI